METCPGEIFFRKPFMMTIQSYEHEWPLAEKKYIGNDYLLKITKLHTPAYTAFQLQKAIYRAKKSTEQLAALYVVFYLKLMFYFQ